MQNSDAIFLEQNILLIFLWISVWELTTLAVAHVGKTMRILIYVLFAVLSITFLLLRGHMERLASL
jgi:hypothetical protein